MLGFALRAYNEQIKFSGFIEGIAPQFWGFMEFMHVLGLK